MKWDGDILTPTPEGKKPVTAPSGRSARSRGSTGTKSTDSKATSREFSQTCPPKTKSGGNSSDSTDSEKSE